MKNNSQPIDKEKEGLKATIKKLQEEVEQLKADKIKLYEFIGRAAHDLKNPIGLVQTFSSLLIEPSFSVPKEQQQRTLRSIYDSSKFSIDLLNDLLNLSRFESGKIEMQFTPLPYTEMVKNNVEVNKDTARKKNIKIRLEVINDIPQIMGDKNKLEQLLYNLIDNAIKYSKNDTTTTVQVESHGENVITRVIDEGQGIPDNEQQFLFQPFQMFSVKSTGGERSTGLGLAISKYIVKEHHGQIGFESKVGKGSTFYFSLPVEQKVKQPA